MSGPGPGPVAWLFGSLANALLDLGLPTIRGWLRDRLGPAADVAHVTTDGALVHLDGVRIPIGPRGLLALDRASATITALGHAGLPEVRLHAFAGVLAFGEAADAFRAEVEFTATPEPDETAWIWGELAIHNASWPLREGSPAASPMTGHARLFVSSRAWRLDGGRLEGEVFRGHFAGAGVFEGEQGEEPADEAPLVPPALSTAALSLVRARVGPFLDAVVALAGKAVVIPSFLPLDAELDGELSWSVVDGGRAEVRVAAEAIRATVRASVGSTGNDLAGRIDAYARPAVVLRGVAGVPPEAMPREEDSVHVELDLGGALRHPTVKGTLRAPEIGFRLGRPRFVPATVLSNLEGEVFLENHRAVLHAVAGARASQIALDVDARVRAPPSIRAMLQADALDVAFLRDVVRTLGAKLHLPDELAGALDFVLVSGDDGTTNAVSGTATLTTPSSKLAFAVAPDGQRRITGRVATHDAIATGLFLGAVAPVEGDLDVAFDVGDHAALSGTVSSSRLALGLRNHPELPAYVLEDARANVAIARDAFAYDELRFRAHGGHFVGRGTIPFVPDASHVPLDLELEEGGADLAEALARLARMDDISIRVAGDGLRPANERWLPRDLRGRGRLTLDGDHTLRTDVILTTPAGTALVLGLRLSHGHLDGTTVAGDLSLADAMPSGFLGDGFEATGTATIDAEVRTATAGAVVLLALRSRHLVVTVEETPFAFSDIAGAIRIDGESVMWNRIEAELCGGAVRTAGIYATTGVQRARVSCAQIAVHRLPPIAGHRPADFVRGLLSGSVVGRLDGRQRMAGDFVIADAAFPAIDRVRPSLQRYGLRPPNEDAASPVTATLVGTEWGLNLRDVVLDLRGATVRGELGVLRDGRLEGRAEVSLEEEYLRTSKVLTLPRVLSDRIVIPVRLDGTVGAPRIRARIGESLGHLLKDNRVSALVTSAVEEAQHLLGRPPSVAPEAPRTASSFPAEAELDAELREALDVFFADWEILRRRLSGRADGASSASTRAPR